MRSAILILPCNYTAKHMRSHTEKLLEMPSKEGAYLVAVHAADNLVDDCEGLGLEGAALFALRIVQVVGVDDAHHVPELVCPAAPVVVPVQVLWLLQHCHVSLHTGTF